MDFISKKPIISIQYDIDAKDVNAYQKMGLLTYECVDSVLYKPRPIGYSCDVNGQIVDIRSLTSKLLLQKLDDLINKKIILNDYQKINGMNCYDWITIINDELIYRNYSKKDVL